MASRVSVEPHEIRTCNARVNRESDERASPFALHHSGEVVTKIDVGQSNVLDKVSTHHGFHDSSTFGAYRTA
jgi:hypothetical protein